MLLLVAAKFEIYCAVLLYFVHDSYISKTRIHEDQLYVLPHTSDISKADKEVIFTLLSYSMCNFENGLNLTFLC